MKDFEIKYYVCDKTTGKAIGATTIKTIQAKDIVDAMDMFTTDNIHIVYIKEL